MIKWVQFMHSNGKSTLVQADSIAEGRRKYIQLGHNLSDVIHSRLIQEDTDSKEQKGKE